MTAQPLISICLLTYNRAKLLPLTIESIIKQSFEILSSLSVTITLLMGLREYVRKWRVLIHG